MNILVVGCGTLGAKLATRLDAEGHDIAIIDPVQRKFSLLGDDFDGITVEGVPIDQDVLRSAGIENCEALAAVTSDDNINIMVAQIAKEFFKVGKVVARINDPDKEDSFSRFGLDTICPTKLGASNVYSELTQHSDIKTLTFGDTIVSFVTVPTVKSSIGHRMSEIKLDSDYYPFAIQHIDGRLTLLKSNDPIINSGDQIIVARSNG